MMRLAITAQTLPGLGQVIDPEKFEICIGMNMYRTNQKQFPVPADAVKVSTLRTPTLSTNGGHFTYNISGCVS